MNRAIWVKVWLFVTPWTVACQAPLSMEISRQEYWSGLPFPCPRNLPNQGSNLVFCTAGRSFTRWATIQSVQSLSRVWLFVTPLTAAGQVFLPITNSQILLKLMSIKLVMPSNHLILYHPLLLLHSILPSIRVFSNESFFASGGQSIGVSASASVLLMNI